MKFEFKNLKTHFHKRQVSILVKTVKCKRDIRQTSGEARGTLNLGKNIIAPSPTKITGLRSKISVKKQNIYCC